MIKKFRGKHARHFPVHGDITARGTFEHLAQSSLKAMGEWMKVNSRAIYGCTEAPAGFQAPANTLLTHDPATNRLYIHLLAYPLNRLTLKNMADKVRYVQFLHDASEINMSTIRSDTGNDILLSLPVQKPPVEVPVLEVYLK